MTKKPHLNFVYSTGENWYCFVLIHKAGVEKFDKWMAQNLPQCRIFKFGTGAGQHYEIHGSTAADRMLFTMRWT